MNTHVHTFNFISGKFKFYDYFSIMNLSITLIRTQRNALANVNG